MEKFKILPHPADLRIEVYGKTIEELFKNAAYAMAKIQNKIIALDEQSLGKCYEEKIKVESVDLNSLLVDFLSEILARSQINKTTYLAPKIEISCQSPNVKCQILAGMVGCPVKLFDEDIKAITYEDLDIKQIDGIWQTKLVFDI